MHCSQLTCQQLWAEPKKKKKGAEPKKKKKRAKRKWTWNPNTYILCIKIKKRAKRMLCIISPSHDIRYLANWQITYSTCSFPNDLCIRQLSRANL